MESSELLGAVNTFLVRLHGDSYPKFVKIRPLTTCAEASLFKLDRSDKERFVLRTCIVAHGPNANRKFRGTVLQTAFGHRHPNLCPVEASFFYKGQLFAIMPRAVGDLFEFLQRRRFPEESVRPIARQVASALALLHRYGIAHRDVKLQNLVVTGSGQIQLIDFGFSTLAVRGQDGLVERDSFARSSCGTPGFAAPEVLSASAYDPFAADVFSLGVVIYGLLFRRLPKPPKGGNVLGCRWTPAASDPLISPPLEALLNKMLSVYPSGRPTLAALSEDPWLTEGMSPQQIAELRAPYVGLGWTRGVVARLEPWLLGHRFDPAACAKGLPENGPEDPDTPGMMDLCDGEDVWAVSVSSGGSDDPPVAGTEVDAVCRAVGVFYNRAVSAGIAESMAAEPGPLSLLTREHVIGVGVGVSSSWNIPGLGDSASDGRTQWHDPAFAASVLAERRSMQTPSTSSIPAALTSRNLFLTTQTQGASSLRTWIDGSCTEVSRSPGSKLCASDLPFRSSTASSIVCTSVASAPVPARKLASSQLTRKCDARSPSSEIASPQACSIIVTGTPFGGISPQRMGSDVDSTQGSAVGVVDCRIPRGVVSNVVSGQRDSSPGGDRVSRRIASEAENSFRLPPSESSVIISRRPESTRHLPRELTPLVNTLAASTSTVDPDDMGDSRRNGEGAVTVTTRTATNGSLEDGKQAPSPADGPPLAPWRRPAHSAHVVCSDAGSAVSEYAQRGPPSAVSSREVVNADARSSPVPSVTASTATSRVPPPDLHHPSDPDYLPTPASACGSPQISHPPGFDPYDCDAEPEFPSAVEILCGAEEPLPPPITVVTKRPDATVSDVRLSMEASASKALTLSFVRTPNHQTLRVPGQVCASFDRSEDVRAEVERGLGASAVSLAPHPTLSSSLPAPVERVCPTDVDPIPPSAPLRSWAVTALM